MRTAKAQQSLITILLKSQLYKQIRKSPAILPSFQRGHCVNERIRLKTYRFSLHGHESFQQVMAKSIAGIDFIMLSLIHFLENDILPFVTLYHFDLPLRWWKNTMVGRIVAAFPHFNAMRKSVIKHLVIESKLWQVTNEQNLMIRVDERMNMYDVAPENVEKFVHKWITICLLPMR